MIDLHVHSTMSDGTYAPAEIAKLASQKGMFAFALTDHDTIFGNTAAKIASKAYKINFINGMEMSLNYDNHQIHVVALGFDQNSEAFKNFYKELRYKKESSIANVIDYLHKQGLDISIEKVQPYVSGDGMDKYAILRYLVTNQSAVGDIQYLWDKYIDPAFRKLKLGIVENPKAEDAIAQMKMAGAVTSLAHFHKKIGFINNNRAEQEYHIKYLHEMGLDGMEAYYPNYTDDDRAFAHYMIEKYNLLPTGGTDFHGANRPSVELGTGTNNNMNVPDEFYINICQKIEERRK
ncbi:Histidinol phosphatase and related hydrolases of the PHP family [Megamonas hypermegale]|uniref:Histidinol phosphatase and related hydrolases of the PHP family n=1 Tax=Megamonas hypermegale TaxID=158847 RepID=A0A239THP3_9FIRM|nr:PHP domain-containing protein [Megamonas hypermegale]SNU96979.1 Histidinol phosphatase and related hydrolases of the PHP family [Megamonas hypermegale]